ncbi:hypothetical protein JW960_14260 [candidate division KSB1 bacterium]|nr:hypothetical protein [candidate division KSB1 bacterium]
MFQIIATMTRLIHRKQEQDKDQGVQYNPEKIESILKEFDDLSIYASDLENLLRIAEQKTHAYEDLLHKYQKIFLEEMSTFRLQLSNISVLNRNFCENELFLSEIQQQLQSFVHENDHSDCQNPVGRLFDRFFHQNELYKTRTRQKLSELNESIEQKKRLLDRMQHDLVSWDRQEPQAFPVAEPQVGMKRAFG